MIQLTTRNGHSMDTHQKQEQQGWCTECNSAHRSVGQDNRQYGTVHAASMHAEMHACTAGVAACAPSLALQPRVLPPQQQVPQLVQPPARTTAAAAAAGSTSAEDDMQQARNTIKIRGMPGADRHCGKLSRARWDTLAAYAVCCVTACSPRCWAYLCGWCWWCWRAASQCCFHLLLVLRLQGCKALQLLSAANRLQRLGCSRLPACRTGQVTIAALQQGSQ
jgi:hypothetical protein